MLTGRSADVLAALRVPLIAAPMTGVSNLEVMRAATAAGIAGSFPLHNAGLPEELDRWLAVLRDEAIEPGRVDAVVDVAQLVERESFDAVTSTR